MIRAALGLFLRQLIPWAVAAACFVFFAWVAIIAATDEELALSAWSVLQGGTRLATILLITGLLLLEGPRLKGQILQRARAIERTTGVPPRRADRVMERWFGWLLVTIFVAVVFVLRLVFSFDCGSIVEFTVSWLAVRAVAWLVIGRFTSWALGRRARKLGVAPTVASAFPLLVAAQVALALAFLWIRPPAGLWGQATTALLEASVPEPTASTRPERSRDAEALRELIALIGSPETEELLIKLGPDDSIGEIRATLNRHSAIASRATPSAPLFSRGSRTWLVTVPSHRARSLILALQRDRENVELVELNPRLAAAPVRAVGRCEPSYLGGATNDPLSGGQRALTESGADQALLIRSFGRGRRSGRFRTPARLAIIDRGVSHEHEDLAGIVVGARAIDERHGTEVAGIAAAIANNGQGMASMNTGGQQVLVHSYPEFSESRPGPDDVADAIYDAVDDGAKVILMAFAAEGPAPSVVRDAVAHAARNDVVLIAAAGNHPRRSADDSWPANLDEVVAVPALDGGRLASFSSSSGRTGAVSAPGNDVCAPDPRGGYHTVDGSSMAAAFLAGVVADRRATCPRDSAAQILLAVGLTSDSPNGRTGPRLNVARLEQMRCAR